MAGGKVIRMMTRASHVSDLGPDMPAVVTAIKKHIDPLPISHELSAAEKKLFDAFYLQLDHEYQVVKSILVSPMMQLQTSVEDMQKHLGNSAKFQHRRAIRLAPLILFCDDVLQQTVQQQAIGLITEQDARALGEVLRHESIDYKKTTINMQTGAITFEFTEGVSGIHKTDLLSTYSVVKASLAKKEMSPSAREWVGAKLEQHKPGIEASDRAINELGKINYRGNEFQDSIGDTFLYNWMLGKERNNKPAFNTPEDAAYFIKTFARGLGKLCINVAEPRMKVSELEEATASLVKRVMIRDEVLKMQIAAEEELQRRDMIAAAERAIAYEQRGVARAALVERHRVEAQQAEELARAQQQEAAIVRQQQRNKAHEAFMAEPRPMPLADSGDKIVRALRTLSASPGHKAYKAGVMVDMVDAAMGVNDAGEALFDTRNASKHELGKLLLSPSALRGQAEAFGLSDSISVHNGAAATESLNERAKRLRRLYTTSDDVKKSVDALLADDAGVLLVAQHTVAPDACGTYASWLADSKKKIEGKTAEIEAGLSDWTEEERLAFADELPVKMQLGEKAKLEAELAEKRTALVAQVQQVFHGAPPRRITGRIAGGEALVLNDVEQSVPSAWLPVINGNYHLQASEQKGKVRVHSNQYPTMSTTVDAGARPDVLKRKLDELAIECGQYGANIELMKELNRDAGFAERDGNFQHSAYDIAVPLGTTELDLSKGLVGAKAKFDQMRFEQESALRTLASHDGVTVKAATAAEGEQPGAVTVRMPGNRTLSLATDGYFTKDDFVIAQAESQRLSAKAVGEAVSVEEDHPSVKGPWVLKTRGSSLELGKESPAIPVDANVLKCLLSRRSGVKEGCTWLPLLATSRHSILIPEPVAYLEMQGRKPTIGESGSILVDRSFHFDPDDENLDRRSKGQNAEHFAQFLEQYACHGTLREDGTIALSGDTSRNVIVVATPGDVDLYRRIDAAQRIGQSLIEAGIYGNDEGEKAMARIIASLSRRSDCIIGATDDKKYIYNSAQRRNNRGAPIPYAGTGVLIDELIHGRPYAEVCHIMKGSPTVHGAFDDIIKAGNAAIDRNGDGVPYIPVHDVGGKHQGAHVTFSRLFRESTPAKAPPSRGGAPDDTVSRQQPWLEESGGSRSGIGWADRNRDVSPRL